MPTQASRVPADLMQQSFILRMRAHSVLWEQFVGPSLKAMRTQLIRPIQVMGKQLPWGIQTPGWGSHTASIYPTELMGSDWPLEDFSSGSTTSKSVNQWWIFFSFDHQHGTLSSYTPSKAICLICLQKSHWKGELDRKSCCEHSLCILKRAGAGGREMWAAGQWSPSQIFL